MQKRAKKVDVEGNLAGPMSYNNVKNSTSSSVGSDEDGGLFDETISAFLKRRDHAENLMIDAIKYGFSSALRPYFNKPQWLTVDDDSEASRSCSCTADSEWANSFQTVTNPFFLSVTAELDQPLQVCSLISTSCDI